MGGKDLPPLLRPSKQYTHTLRQIRSLHDDDKDPVIAVDVSNWLVAGLSSQPAVEQYHSAPKVPATAVKNYILDHVDRLLKARFIPVLVFDGQRNPLKAAENARRRDDANVEEALQRLQKIYAGEEDVSYKDSDDDSSTETDWELFSSDEEEDEYPTREEDEDVF